MFALLKSFLLLHLLLWRYTQYRITYNKMVGDMSIFLPDTFGSLGFWDSKLSGAWNLVVYEWRGARDEGEKPVSRIEWRVAKQKESNQ